MDRDSCSQGWLAGVTPANAAPARAPAAYASAAGTAPSTRSARPGASGSCLK
jgi:hypothetical protein